MDCTGRPDVSKLLDGELPPAGVREAFHHLRSCPACREALEEGRRARRDLKALADDLESENSSSAEPVGPRFIRSGLFGRLVPGHGGGGGGAPSHPGRPRRKGGALVLLAAAVIAAVVGFVRRGDAPEMTPERRAAEAVARGEAAFLAPVGAQDGRPRLAAALLGAPPPTARLVVCGPDGDVVWNAPVRPGENGASVLPYRIDAPGAARELWRFAAPFPDAETLPLAAGVPYAAALVFPGGVIAAGAPFVVHTL